MSSELDSCEAAWHDCAAQVDMIIDCQTKLKEQLKAQVLAQQGANRE